MIDLHTHSNVSDGTDSPEELLRKAKEKGIKALALTDHDTLSGLIRAEECAKAHSIDFIRGCELSTRTEDGHGNERKLHILGLWIPKKCDELEGFLEEARVIRNKRNLLIIRKLQKLGIQIELEELGNFNDESVGRPHIAQLLMKKGYVKSINEAFYEYLSSKGKAYVPKKSVSPEEAISILSKQGAMVFLAHPLLEIDNEKAKNFIPWLEEMLPAWRSLGLSGLEAWHSVHNRAQTDILISLANKHGLEITGGSDYHGTVKKDVKLGYAFDNQAIPDSIYTKLKDFRKIKGYDD